MAGSCADERGNRANSGDFEAEGWRMAVVLKASVKNGPNFADRYPPIGYYLAVIFSGVDQAPDRRNLARIRAIRRFSESNPITDRALDRCKLLTAVTPPSGFPLPTAPTRWLCGALT